jgi:hypothetical protein
MPVDEAKSQTPQLTQEHPLQGLRCGQVEHHEVQIQLEVMLLGYGYQLRLAGDMADWSTWSEVHPESSNPKKAVNFL